MSPEDVDNRLKSLIDEGQAIRGVNNGSGHNNPAFKAWRQRAHAALEDKQGHDSRVAREFGQLKFYFHRRVVSPSTPPATAAQHQASFNTALDDALALLVAATEAQPRHAARGQAPLVHIEQIGSSAAASASADVRVHVTVEQLRQLVASEPGLAPRDRAEAIAALPDDPAELTIENVDRLLDVATKGKRLFKPVLGWLIAHADQIPWLG